MSRPTSPCEYKLDKKVISALIIYAINNIPHCDEFTLKKFLELMGTTGSFGSISVKQLARIMGLLLKHVPGTQPASLRLLVELLSIHLPLQLDGQGNLRLAPPNDPDL